MKSERFGSFGVRTRGRTPRAPQAIVQCVVRPPRIELGLRVPETLVISFSLRAPADFLTSATDRVNDRNALRCSILASYGSQAGLSG